MNHFVIIATKVSTQKFIKHYLSLQNIILLYNHKVVHYTLALYKVFEHLVYKTGTVVAHAIAIAVPFPPSTIDLSNEADFQIFFWARIDDRCHVHATLFSSPKNEIIRLALKAQPTSLLLARISGRARLHLPMHRLQSCRAWCTLCTRGNSRGMHD